MESIAIALFLCLLLAILTRRFSLPPIPFYIIAGLLIGNSGIRLIHTDPFTDLFSHLGLIFLLFYSGLGMKPERFIRKGSGLLISGLVDLNVNVLIGFFGALALGFGPFDAFVVGSALFDTSSAISLASLIDNKKLISSESETIVWMMVFEDLLMVFLIFFISAKMEHPFILVLKIISIIIFCYALITAIRKPLISILKRDDEVPVMLTVTSVLAASGAAIYLNIPEAVPLIALGSALSKTNPIILQRITTPFKDIFLALLFIFFGVSIQLSGYISFVFIVVISLLAIGSKVFTGLIVGKLLHNSYTSGVEIGDYTIARGEFAIVLAAIYGSPMVSTTVAAVVIITSIFGSFTSKYSDNIHKWVIGK